MPRYFFDVRDGRELIRDDGGSEFARYEDARCEAVETLPQIAKDKSSGRDHWELEVTMRKDNVALCRARLTFDGEKLTSDGIASMV